MNNVIELNDVSELIEGRNYRAFTPFGTMEVLFITEEDVLDPKLKLGCNYLISYDEARQFLDPQYRLEVFKNKAIKLLDNNLFSDEFKNEIRIAIEKGDILEIKFVLSKGIEALNRFFGLIEDYEVVSYV